MVNILDDEDLYDYVTLAGARSPGVVTLTGHDSRVEWDVKDGPGQDGASMTRKGRKPIVFQASFFLADRDDFEAWPAFAAVINSTVASATPKALDIYHPDLSENDIKSIVKGSIKGPKHDGKGGVIRVVEFTEYLPPKPKGGSPSGAKARQATDPNADLQAEIARLTNQYQNTPWG